MQVNKALLQEFVQVLISCSSAPLGGTQERNANYLIGKIRYFRAHGLPESILHELESKIVIFCTDYYITHFDMIYRFFRKSIIPIAKAIDQLADQNDEQAYIIGQPIVKIMRKRQYEFINKKLKTLSFSDDFEGALYVSIFDNVPITKCDGWSLFFRSYLRIIDNLRFSNKKQYLLEDMKEILCYAQHRCPITAGILMYKAKYFDYMGDPKSAELCYRTALQYVYTANGPYGITAIFLDMAKHYVKSNVELSNAFVEAAGKYNKEAAEINSIVLKYMKKDDDTKDNTVSYHDILRKHNYKADFSSYVYKTARIIKESPYYKENKNIIDEILS